MEGGAWVITLRSALGFEISTVLSSIDIALCDGWLQDDKAVEAGPKGMGGVTPGQHTGQATEAAPRATGLPRFFYRLSARAQRCYLKSDSIERFELNPGATAFSLADALMRALAGGAPALVQRSPQALASDQCRRVEAGAVAVCSAGVP